MMSSSNSGNQGDCPKVVVVGGGFGGLTCQNELRKSMPSAAITIVDPNERFTFLPLLYEYLGGFADLDEIAPTYDFLLSSQQTAADLLPNIKNKASDKSVAMKRGSAVAVDPDNKTLTVQDVPSGKEETLSYDALIVSCGMPPSTPKAGRPSIPSTAYPFATLDDAVRLKRRLGLVKAMDGSSSIVIVGGGYVGSELACTIAQTLPRNAQITILHRDATGVCTGAEDYNRESAQERLHDLGVNVQLGATVTNVESITADDGQSYDNVEYTTESGNEGSIRADVLIWTVAGATSKPRDTVKGLPMDDRGRVIVSPTCKVQGLDNVYAIGDGAVVSSDTSPAPSSPYPATAQVAMQQAGVAAYNVQLDLEGTSSSPKKTFTYQSLGEMLSLGGDEDASIASLNGLFTLNGPLASTARRLVYAARMPTPKQSVRSGAGYVLGGLIRGGERVLGMGKNAVDDLTR
jgi:NADH dehydrogenase